MANGISWKEFEAIVARLHKTFHKGGGTVRIDQHLDGMRTGRKRQIDISVETIVGGETLLMIIECKKWNRKADVNAVEAFAGVKRDVRAHIGIMVSTKGFTPAAYSLAEHENIRLYKYRDTLREDWPNGLETSVLMEVWELTPTTAYLVLKGGAREDIPTDEGLDFHDLSTGKDLALASLVRRIWESFPESDKREWSWLVEFDCTTPERPEIQRLGIGAKSIFIRGVRKGRLQFEGFVDEQRGHAKVNAWNMVFDGEMTPWPKEKPLPRSQTYSLAMHSVFVRTEDRKTEGMQQLIYKGILEIGVVTKRVVDVPIFTPLKSKE